MSEYTIQHGTRHAPRGSDPSAADPWSRVVTSGAAWSSGTNYDDGDVANNNDLQYTCMVANGPGHGGAIEPGVDSHWVAYWHVSASLFVNGSNMGATVAIPNPVPLRYRLSVGAPNLLDVDGTILVHTEHQIEIQGDVEGLNIGDTVFVIGPEYRHEYDVPYHTHDSFGGYVACRLLSTGEFIWRAP